MNTKRTTIRQFLYVAVALVFAIAFSWIVYSLIKDAPLPFERKQLPLH